MDYYLQLHFVGSTERDRVRITVSSMDAARAHARKVLARDSAYRAVTIIEYDFYTGEETRETVNR